MIPLNTEKHAGPQIRVAPEAPANGGDASRDEVYSYIAERLSFIKQK
jgi:hypothetical protein